MKLSNNVLKYRYHVLRPWLFQPFFLLLFFLSPALDIFRVDMLHEKLVFLGNTYPFEWQYLQWLPLGFYGLVLVIAFASTVFGRVFCGWVCPHNTLSEWLTPLRALVGLKKQPPWMMRFFNKFPALLWPLRFLFPTAALLVTIVLAFCLVGYIVPPKWVIDTTFFGKPEPAVLLGVGLITLIGMFLLLAGHYFCKAACPYGLFQSVAAYHSRKWAPMEIRFTADPVEDCKSCTVCEQVCPVDIDPRNPDNLKVGSFPGCFNCGECIDACKFLHSFKEQPGLLNFRMLGELRELPIYHKPEQKSAIK